MTGPLYLSTPVKLLPTGQVISDDVSTRLCTSLYDAHMAHIDKTRVQVDIIYSYEITRAFDEDELMRILWSMNDCYFRHNGYYSAYINSLKAVGRKHFKGE